MYSHQYESANSTGHGTLTGKYRPTCMCFAVSANASAISETNSNCKADHTISPVWVYFCTCVPAFIHVYTHTVWTSLFQSESDRGQCENLMIVGFWGPLFRDPSLPLQIPGLILPTSCDKDQISVLSVSGGRMRWSVWVRRWRLWSRKCQLNLCPQPPVSAEEDTEAQGCVVTCPRLQSKFKSEPELESKASGSVQHLPKMPWGGIKRRD